MIRNGRIALTSCIAAGAVLTVAMFLIIDQSHSVAAEDDAAAVGSRLSILLNLSFGAEDEFRSRLSDDQKKKLGAIQVNLEQTFQQLEEQRIATKQRLHLIDQAMRKAL